MAVNERKCTSELRIPLEELLVDQDEEASDDYGDNYVRRISGPIPLVSGEPETEEDIGVELIYFDGSPAVDNGLDIVAEPVSNDLLAMSEVTILPEYRGHEYGTGIVRKIIETVGYHYGAVVMRPEDRTEGAPEIIAEEEPAYGSSLELRPTWDPSILLVIPY